MNSLTRAFALPTLVTAAVIALTADARGSWATFAWESHLVITPALPDQDDLIRFSTRLDPPFYQDCSPGTLDIIVDQDAWRVQMNWHPWVPEGADGCDAADRGLILGAIGEFGPLRAGAWEFWSARQDGSWQIHPFTVIPEPRSIIAGSILPMTLLRSRHRARRRSRPPAAAIQGFEYR